MQKTVKRAFYLSKGLIESGFVWSFPSEAHKGEEMNAGHGLGRQSKVQKGTSK